MKKVLLSFVLLALLISCSKESSSGEVKYEVTSSPAGFDITYENSTGNTEQQTITSNTWSVTFIGNSGDFVYISAQADNTNATITTKIYYKGSIIEQATSQGDYVIATASGTIP